MLYDLNVPWTPSTPPADLLRTISFLTSLGYHTLALTHSLSATAIPAQISNPIPSTLSPLPANTTLLRRLTLTLSDPTQNHRLRPSRSLRYSSAAPYDRKGRFPFHWKPKPAMTAVARGVRFEICYAQATGAGMGQEQRRNFIGNVVGIVRATKGRGLLISSGGVAGDVLGVRGPADVLNLLGVWGLGRERGTEGMGCNPRGVVLNEGLKRRGFRGVVDVVEGGERAVVEQKNKGGAAVSGSGAQGAGKKEKGKGKRVAEQDGADGTPISKRQAKRLKLEALKAEKQSSQSQKEGGSLKDAMPLKEKSTLKESDTPSTTKEKANG
ncbi:putative ribonuclease P protein subunit [Lachnellula subtilissima]|uniref:Putative ribonuclease P protein subunit n=1 Tax=Lachnellula subtilissima TaxID=602034 RepID=A0A8H8RIA4_9HELO|nr:putative ribonuclease P protein subunit [Lachnellula subtilissima]